MAHLPNSSTGIVVASVASAASSLLKCLSASVGAPGAKLRDFLPPEQEHTALSQKSGQTIAGGATSSSQNIELDIMGDFITATKLVVVLPALGAGSEHLSSSEVPSTGSDAASSAQEHGADKYDGSSASTIAFFNDDNVAYKRFAPFAAIANITGQIGQTGVMDISGVGLWMWNYLQNEGALHHSTDKFSSSSVGDRHLASKKTSMCVIDLPFLCVDRPYVALKAAYSSIKLKVTTRPIKDLVEYATGKSPSFGIIDAKYNTAYPAVFYMQEASYITGTLKQQIADLAVEQGIKVPMAKVSFKSAAGSSGTEVSIRGTLAASKVSVTVCNEDLSYFADVTDIQLQANNAPIGISIPQIQNEGSQKSGSMDTNDMIASNSSTQDFSGGNGGSAATVAQGKLDSMTVKATFTADEPVSLNALVKEYTCALYSQHTLTHQYL